MSVIGIGIDVVEVRRMEATLSRYGARPFRHFFTPEEIAESTRHREPARRLAECFAAKEAAFKALGTGWTGSISWHDVHVDPEHVREPLKMRGEAARIAADLGSTRSVVAFSSRDAIAVAVVVLSSS